MLLPDTRQTDRQTYTEEDKRQRDGEDSRET